MTALEWVGAIVAMFVAGGICAAGVGMLINACTDKWQRIVWRATEAHLRKRGDEMRCQQYWFETKTQAAMWMACAKAMSQGEYPDAQAVRDRDFKEALAKLDDARKL